MSNANIELSILMPCLNESETIQICIEKAKNYLKCAGITGEILIADNGSTDDSQILAEALGARVIIVPVRGYGAALRAGINAARGRFVIMGDADDSYDFSALNSFLEKLREGYDLVIGNRFQGGIQPGAMPALHRYLGNPILSYIGRLLFKSEIRDFHCGLRGFNRNAIRSLDLWTDGMEYASEMIVKATIQNLTITEVPTVLYPDGRSRPPHLRSWRDGWRHLRFLLIYSPKWLFLIPGLLLSTGGLLLLLLLVPGPFRLGSVTFDIHTMLYAGISIILGVQLTTLAVYSKVFSICAGLIPPNPKLAWLLAEPTLEFSLLSGGLLALAGTIGSIIGIVIWGASDFGPIVAGSMMRVTIPSLVCLAVGVQIMFAGFFVSTLRLIRLKV